MYAVSQPPHYYYPPPPPPPSSSVGGNNYALQPSVNPGYGNSARLSNNNIYNQGSLPNHQHAPMLPQLHLAPISLQHHQVNQSHQFRNHLRNSSQNSRFLQNNQQPYPAPPPHHQQQETVVDDKGYNSYVMAKFAAEFAFDVLQGYVPQIPESFVTKLTSVLDATRLSKTSVLLGLTYLHRRKRLATLSHRGELQYNLQNEKIFLYTAVALIIANKYNDDNTFTNRSWSNATGISIQDLNSSERDWLVSCNYDLHFNVQSQQFKNQYYSSYNPQPYETRPWLVSLDTVNPKGYFNSQISYATNEIYGTNDPAKKSLTNGIQDYQCIESMYNYFESHRSLRSPIMTSFDQSSNYYSPISNNNSYVYHNQYEDRYKSEIRTPKSACDFNNDLSKYSTRPGLQKYDYPNGLFSKNYNDQYGYAAANNNNNNTPHDYPLMANRSQSNFGHQLPHSGFDSYANCTDNSNTAAAVNNNMNNLRRSSSRHSINQSQTQLPPLLSTGLGMGSNSLANYDSASVSSFPTLGYDTNMSTSPNYSSNYFNTTLFRGSDSGINNSGLTGLTMSTGGRPYFFNNNGINDGLSICGNNNRSFQFYI
ncbi:Clg1 protein [Saccharomycopsis crataegensis]|uniref:Clg1 protein n=1 Tax=Saccharomycopsis crataegensis TaxID=43959 RepID=A0AAV5QLI0_9ASCO|nr:Clg1 protein [Saccharomycopsis crataegensis]